MNRFLQIIGRYKFPSFVVAVILVAAVLVSISMVIYYHSEAYRLDLSRPEYETKRGEIGRDMKDESGEFEVQGKVDTATIDDFLKRYDTAAAKATGAKAFANDVLGDEELGLGVESTVTNE